MCVLTIKVYAPACMGSGKGGREGGGLGGGRYLECWKACAVGYEMPLEGGPRCVVVGTSLGFC